MRNSRTDGNVCSMHARYNTFMSHNTVLIINYNTYESQHCCNN